MEPGNRTGEAAGARDREGPREKTVGEDSAEEPCGSEERREDDSTEEDRTTEDGTKEESASCWGEEGVAARAVQAERSREPMPLLVKSVWSPIDRRHDGLRILATRFRGRGMPADRYHVWMPSLGPSEQLLQAVQAGTLTWAQFTRAFKRELFLDGPIDDRCRTIKNHGQKFTLRLIGQLAQRTDVTLMCHCAEDEAHCHRHILRAVILRA